jgi:hypothetical protein
MWFAKTNKLTIKPGAGGSRLSSQYSGGREQEDLGWRPAWANSSRDPILKKPITKKGLVMSLKV